MKHQSTHPPVIDLSSPPQWKMWPFKLLSADLEAGVAQTLAHFHQWHCGSKSNQWEPLSEQHGDPQAAQRGGLWFLQWPNDPGQGQTPEGQVSWCTSLQTPPCSLKHISVTGKPTVNIQTFQIQNIDCLWNITKQSRYWMFRYVSGYLSLFGQILHTEASSVVPLSYIIIIALVPFTVMLLCNCLTRHVLPVDTLMLSTLTHSPV